MKRKITIACDSQSLSAYQRCAESYNYAHVLSLESIKIKRAFERGGFISRMLQIWYWTRQRNAKYHVCTFTKTTAVERAIINRTLDTEFLDMEDSALLARKLREYFNFYRSESWKILAQERGFSKVLYEDDNVLFVYEGRPDLIVRPLPSQYPDKLAPVDHKTEGRKNPLYFLRNQFIGYAWACETDWLVVNYFGLQETMKPVECFRREIFSYSKAQIDQWISDTTEWYFKILESTVSRHFLRSWQCEGKYGLCQYTPLCSQPLGFIRADQIKRNFQKRREQWKAW